MSPEGPSISLEKPGIGWQLKEMDSSPDKANLVLSGIFVQYIQIGFRLYLSGLLLY